MTTQRPPAAAPSTAPAAVTTAWAAPRHASARHTYSPRTNRQPRNKGTQNRCIFVDTLGLNLRKTAAATTHMGTRAAVCLHIHTVEGCRYPLTYLMTAGISAPAMTWSFFDAVTCPAMMPTRNPASSSLNITPATLSSPPASCKRRGETSVLKQRRLREGRGWTRWLQAKRLRYAQTAASAAVAGVPQQQRQGSQTCGWSGRLTLAPHRS
jgi:hypothetical protein